MSAPKKMRRRFTKRRRIRSCIGCQVLKKRKRKYSIWKKEEK